MASNSDAQSNSKRSVSAVAGLVALAVVLSAGAYAWLTYTSPRLPTAPPEQVIIATNTEYVGTCAVMAAQEKGYFAGEGILAVIQSYSSGKTAMEALVQGKANLATVADIPVMFAGLDNSPVSVIATIFRAEKDHGIVGRKDKGVNTPESLKGKRIGVTLSTTGHFTLNAFLNRQRLLPDEVTMRNYKPEELPLALVQGEVDAIATWEPFLEATMTQLGSNGMLFYGQDVYESIYNVAGTRDYIAGHPATIKKILRALSSGARFCNDSPDAARALITATTKKELNAMKASWPSYRFSIVLDQGLILALEDEARWAIKNKLTTKTAMPNYLDYVYLDGLEAVTPSAVTIIH